jgi:KDO2-lipid IV(A) lauroyltransferase
LQEISFKQKLSFKFESYIFYLYETIIDIFDEKAIKYIRFLISPFLRNYKKVVKKNLEIAFGIEYSNKNWKNIFNSCVENLLLNIATVIKNKNKNRDDINNFVEFENRETIDNLIKNGESIIFTSGHFGNWEFMASAISSLITPSYAIVEKLKNIYLDEVLNKNRQNVGVKTVAMKGAIKTIVSAIKRKEAVMMLTDQSLNRGYGIEKPFFGLTAIHSETPSFLSRKYGSYIVPTYIFNNQNKYKIVFKEPFKAENIIDPLQYELNILEDEIRKSPESWLWCHRRWKNNKNIYNN